MEREREREREKVKGNKREVGAGNVDREEVALRIA